MNVFRTPVRTPGDQARDPDHLRRTLPGTRRRDPDRRSLHPANQFRHDQRNFGQRLADSVTGVFGSWRFIIVQTIIVSAWIGLNVIAFGRHWDPYPFILLNLMFSTQAAYAAPLILLSQNRQADTDRVKAEHDYQVNQLALQYLIAWHRDAHGDGCACVRESEPAVQAALASIARGVPRPRTAPARKS